MQRLEECIRCFCTCMHAYSCEQRPEEYIKCFCTYVYVCSCVHTGWKCSSGFFRIYVHVCKGQKNVSGLLEYMYKCVKTGRVYQVHLFIWVCVFVCAEGGRVYQMFSSITLCSVLWNKCSLSTGLESIKEHNRSCPPVSTPEELMLQVCEECLKCWLLS